MEEASDSGNQTSIGQTWIGQTWFGSLLIAASATAYSTAGFFTRLIDLDIWTVLFWRGLFAGLFIAGCVIWQNGRETGAAVRAIGRRGLWVALSSTFATICFLNALRLTSVAEVTSPFITGMLAWLFIGERARWTTVVASLFALLGVIVMFDPASSAGHLAGNVLAFVMTLSLAAMVVTLRHSRATSMLPATCLSALLCPIVVWPIANPGAAIGVNFIYLALFGIIQFGLGLLLLTTGTRLVTAIRSSLIGRLQIPLAPAWVWLAFGEVPTLVTCVGGLVVVAAIAGEAAIRKMGP